MCRKPSPHPHCKATRMGISVQLAARGLGALPLGTGPGERRGTLLTELRPRLVLVLAPGALHGPAPPVSSSTKVPPRQKWTESKWRHPEGQGSSGRRGLIARLSRCPGAAQANQAFTGHARGGYVAADLACQYP